MGSYYRTRQHIVPNGVQEGSRLIEHGWGIVCQNFRSMRCGSAEKVASGSNVGGDAEFDRRVRVELMSFQMAVGVAGDEGSEVAKFHDLVARGEARQGEREEVLRNWCDRGVIPSGFMVAQGQ